MNMDMKVINLGLPKTGTTTLTRALRRAGLRTVDWRVRRKQTQDPDLVRKHIGVILYRDYFDHGDPLRRLKSFDAFNELSHAGLRHSVWPQTDWGLLDAIQTHYPKAKFTLNMRDPAETANSIMRWTNLGTLRLPKGNVPGLPSGFGVSEAELARWVEGHYRFCERVFHGADNFLAFDITDEKAPDKIGAFLGRELPWWGVANAGKPEPEGDAAPKPAKKKRQSKANPKNNNELTTG